MAYEVGKVSWLAHSAIIVNTSCAVCGNGDPATALQRVHSHRENTCNDLIGPVLHVCIRICAGI